MGPLGKTAAVVLTVGALLSIGCSTATRYRVLSKVFDGVPPPTTPAEATSSSNGAGDAVVVRAREHGPYAAGLCTGCHESGAGNALVAPAQELCFRCHALSMDKKYVHGPMASGGCLGCHDPHASQYAYLLVAPSREFCVRCHERVTLAPVAGHENPATECTSCHDAHSSDQPHLLR